MAGHAGQEAGDAAGVSAKGSPRPGAPAGLRPGKACHLPGGAFPLACEDEVPATGGRGSRDPQLGTRAGGEGDPSLQAATQVLTPAAGGALPSTVAVILGVPRFGMADCAGWGGEQVHGAGGVMAGDEQQVPGAEWWGGGHEGRWPRAALYVHLGPPRPSGIRAGGARMRTHGGGCQPRVASCPHREVAAVLLQTPHTTGAHEIGG